MTSDDEDKKRAAFSREDARSSSSLGRSSKHRKKRDHAKEKERSRKSRSSHPATTPGAVASTDGRRERQKEGRSSGSSTKDRSRSSTASTPGAVRSSSRADRTKGSTKDGSDQKSRSSRSVNKSSSSVDADQEAKNRARRHSSSKPGAVSSTGRDREKGGSSSSSSKPGAVASTEKDKRKSTSTRSGKPGAVASTESDRGKGRSGKSDGKSSTDYSSRKSTSTRAVSDEKAKYLMSPSATKEKDIDLQEMETAVVAEAVHEVQDNVRREQEQEARIRATIEEERRREEEQREEERRQKEMMKKRKQRRNCIILVAVLVIAGGAAGAYFGLKGGSSSQLPLKDTTTDSPNTTVSSVNPTNMPSSFTPLDPSSAPTNLVYDPPSEEDCKRLSEGLSPLGETSMYIRNFDVPLDIGFTSVDTEISEVIPELEEKIGLYMVPRIVGCPVTQRRLDGRSSSHRRQLQNIKYMIADIKVRITVDDNKYCVADSAAKCDVVRVSLTVKLRGDERSFRVILLLGEYFEQDKDLSDDLRLSDLIGSCTRRMEIRATDPTTSPTIAPTETSSASPTNTPTLTVSSSPSMRPVFGAVPETKAPTRSPSKVPAFVPTSVPVPGVTTSPTDTASESPTQNLSRSPTKAPTKLPTPGLTPDPTVAPSIMLSLSPTIRPSKEPSSAPSMYPSESPSAAPTSKRTRLEAILSRFVPFDGNKGLALDWLAMDTWEPPIDVTDETPLWEERFALAVFYHATGGDGWSNKAGWLTSAHVCTWTGILACNGDGSVTDFRLQLKNPARNYGLVGDFPDEMRALTNLEWLSFEYNRNLSGTIPSFITALTKLIALNLGDTGRTGSIPSELWTLTNLNIVALYGNFLTGTIPPGIGRMTQLVGLTFLSNDLTGSLPDEFDRMLRLTSLSVHENYLTGTIPPLLSSLADCRLALEDSWGIHYLSRKTEGNCFTDTTNALGTCNLSANQCWLEATLSRFSPFDGNKGLALDWLKADTWTPPSTAADKKALWEERFALAVFYYATGGDGWSNKAGWLTSAHVCTWTGILACNGDGSVTDFRLQLKNPARNYGLVGDFPDEMRALTNVEWLSFEYNRNLSGTIPSFITALTKLMALNLGDTGRTGSIPSELWTLTNLNIVALYGNFLTGTIPPGIGRMTQLVGLTFLSNDLTGSLPDEFDRMPRLTSLSVHENYLTGTIPPLLSSLADCRLALEDSWGIHYLSRKTEGNCFTDTTNALGTCNLSANCQ